MKARPIIFHKNYTRDTALILQQLWALAMEEGIKQLGIARKYGPAVVDFTVDGVCEIWENDQVNSYIKKQFISLCQKEPRRVLLFLDWFQRGVKELEPIWQKKHLSDLPALKNFIARVNQYMIGDLFIIVGQDKRLSGPIKKLAAELRAKDHYFVATNQIIISTLRRIFPKLKDYVEVLRIEDLDDLPSKSELRRRFKNYICVSDGYAKIETLKEYARKRPYVFREEKVQKVNGGIKGVVANSGHVIGRAKLVFTTRDLNKVEKGDIIISPMTTADFMPALKRAAAIVTDEGGIICHAAIVARELKKPCLIATKAATRFFADGDLVEVDTDKKVARKLN